jgi:hypothetical protein
MIGAKTVMTQRSITLELLLWGMFKRIEDQGREDPDSHQNETGVFFE